MSDKKQEQPGWPFVGRSRRCGIVIAAVLLGKGGQTTTVDPASTPSDVSADGCG